MISNKLKIDHQYAKELLQLSSQCKLEKPTHESGVYKVLLFILLNYFSAIKQFLPVETFLISIKVM